MPNVKKIQAAVVQGRDQRAQAVSSRPAISEAMAKENATENPTYPIYSNGGWKISPISCNTGFKSCPSMGTSGKVRLNGLEVNKINTRKPALMIPITDSTRAMASSGMLRLNSATASVQPLSNNTQSSSDPSWAPQVAAMR